MKAYEDALEATTTEEAPWYVIPADHKWFTRLAVADVIVEALEEIDPHFPQVSSAQREELAAGAGAPRGRQTRRARLERGRGQAAVDFEDCRAVARKTPDRNTSSLVTSTPSRVATHRQVSGALGRRDDRAAGTNRPTFTPCSGSRAEV